MSVDKDWAQDIFDELCEKMQREEKEFPFSIGGPVKLIPLRKLKKLPFPYCVSYDIYPNRQVRFRTEAEREIAMDLLKGVT